MICQIARVLVIRLHHDQLCISSSFSLGFPCFFFASHILCLFGGTIFYLLAATTVVVALFVMIGVPKTANLLMVEDQIVSVTWASEDFSLDG